MTGLVFAILSFLCMIIGASKLIEWPDQEADEFAEQYYSGEKIIILSIVFLIAAYIS